MKTDRKLGDVDLEDYGRMVAADSWRGARMLAMAAACVLAFTAGRFAPWSGKDSKHLSMTDAADLLGSRTTEEWARQLGAHAVFLHASRGIEALDQLADEDAGQAAANAALYLGMMAAHTTRSVRRLTEGNGPPELGRYLADIRATVRE